LESNERPAGDEHRHTADDFRVVPLDPDQGISMPGRCQSTLARPDDSAAQERQERRGLVVQMRGLAMAETTKLSVEKALEKLRGNDASKSKDERRAADMEKLDDEIKRMRAQRQRLERHQRKRN
jgi:hypothetical protein